MRQFVAILFFGLLLVGCGKESPKGAVTTFTISVSDSLIDAPLDGRLLLMLADNPDAEPRFQISAGLSAQPVFGMNVDQMKAGESQVFDGEVFGFPYASLADVPPGDYWEKPLGATFLEGLPDPVETPWLTSADLDFYEAEFKQSGFRGPLNRYRNHQRDFEWLQGWKGKRIEQAALFIGGMRDPATFLFGATMDPVGLTKMFAPQVEGHILKGCGHWTQQEKPEQVNAILIDWLKRL